MLNILAFLAASTINIYSPTHYAVDLTATQNAETLATSHLLAESKHTVQFVQEDRDQRLVVKLVPLPNKDETTNFDVYLEATSASGETVRKETHIFALNDGHHFIVDMHAMADQPAIHFDFTVTEVSSASARSHS